MGVSGAGKTAVGERLAARLGWPFVDADDLHPASNVRKMRRGVPLTDEDRLPWLRSVREAMIERSAFGRSAVVACSVLKREYRELLLSGEGSSGEPPSGDAPRRRADTRLVYLRATPVVLERRLAARRGHFFDPDLLASQLETLEEPEEEGPEGALVVDADAELAAVVDAVVAGLDLPDPG